MCFSKEVSLATFLTGFIGGLLCFSTGVTDLKIIGLFFMFVSLMQGIEYLLWIHQTCDDYNKNISYLAMILNHLQPVVLFILLCIYNKPYKKLFFIILIYLIFIIPYSLKFKNTCTMKDKNHHLNWEWNSMKYNKLVYAVFLFCLVSLGFFFPNKTYGKSFSLFTLLSYIISYCIYTKTNVVGSMWCFFTAFGPLFYLFYFHKNKS